MDKLKNIWNERSPKEKKNIVLFSALAIIIVVLLMGYKATGRGSSEAQAKPMEKTAYDLNGDDVEKSLYHQIKSFDIEAIPVPVEIGAKLGIDFDTTELDNSLK